MRHATRDMLGSDTTIPLFHNSISPHMLFLTTEYTEYTEWEACYSVCSVYSVVYNLCRFDNRFGGAFPARLADEDAVFGGDAVAVGGFIRLEVGHQRFLR